MKRRLAKIWRRRNENVGKGKERESNGLVREEREKRKKERIFLKKKKRGERKI